MEAGAHSAPGPPPASPLSLARLAGPRSRPEVGLATRDRAR